MLPPRRSPAAVAELDGAVVQRAALAGCQELQRGRVGLLHLLRGGRGAEQAAEHARELAQAQVHVLLRVVRPSRGPVCICPRLCTGPRLAPRRRSAPAHLEHGPGHCQQLRWHRHWLRLPCRLAAGQHLSALRCALGYSSEVETLLSRRVQHRRQGRLVSCGKSFCADTASLGDRSDAAWFFALLVAHEGHQSIVRTRCREARTHAVIARARGSVPVGALLTARLANGPAHTAAASSRWDNSTMCTGASRRARASAGAKRGTNRQGRCPLDSAARVGDGAACERAPGSLVEGRARLGAGRSNLPQSPWGQPCAAARAPLGGSPRAAACEREEC